MAMEAGGPSSVILYASSHKRVCSSANRTRMRVLRTLKGEGACSRALVMSSRMRSFEIGVFLDKAYTERRDAIASRKGILDAMVVHAFGVMGTVAMEINDIFPRLHI